MASTMREFIDERLRDKSVEEVSRIFFPKYWDEKEAALEEALTKHDQPCMSSFQA